MKTTRDVVVLSVALISLAISLTAIVKRSSGPENPVSGEAAAASGEARAVEVARLRETLSGLRDEIEAMKAALGTPVTAAAPAAGEEGEEGGDVSGPAGAGFTSIDQRIASLESSVGRLQGAFDGISVEGNAEERKAMFRAEDGFEKADAFFEAGKYTIAADGYLQFVEAHPDHPDSRDILQKARQSFERAGYSDMAIYVQEEMMKSFPDNRATDLMTLAGMKKVSGRYDEAIQHATEAADMVSGTQQEYWNRLYAAWYTQLHHGPEAGLQAYLDVQGQIQRAGFGDSKMGNRAQEQIDEIRRQIQGQRGMPGQKGPLKVAESD